MLYFKQPKKNTLTREILFILSLTFCFVASCEAETKTVSLEQKYHKPCKTKKTIKVKTINKKDQNPVAVSSNEADSNYQPHVELGFSQDFGGNNKTGIETDAFMPIFGTPTKLLFSNIKINNYSNRTFDGGFYLGYRYLLPEDQQLYGIYAAYDFKKTDNGNFFNQLTLGVEYWIHHWFFGASVHKPIGNQVKNNNIGYYEKAVPGISGEIGYEFSKKMAVFLEGYYFNTSSPKNAPGIKVKLKHILFKNENQGILDQIKLEAGVRKDKLTGNSMFLELSFKIGGASKNTEQDDGVSVHMTDTVFRNKGQFVIENIAKKSAPDKQVKKNTSEELHCYYGFNGKDGDPNVLEPSGSSKSCPQNISGLNNPAYKIVETVKQGVYPKGSTFITVLYTP